MTVQTIRTQSGEELIVLTRREYDALLARAGDEEAEDRMSLLLLEEARDDEPMPQPVTDAMMAGDRLLRAIRKWRGLTQDELAAKAEVNQGYLSELETGAKSGSEETLRRLARALDVPENWLV